MVLNLKGHGEVCLPESACENAPIIYTLRRTMKEDPLFGFNKDMQLKLEEHYWTILMFYKF